MAKKKDYFKTICSISKAFGTTLDTSELLDLIVSSSIETMDAKAACLFLADKTKDIFVPMAQKGLSDKYLHAKPMRARKLVDEILEGGHLVFRDATTDPRLENHEAKKAEGIASILSVPVMVRDEAIGILSLYTDTPRDFDQEEIDFQIALAEQGGMAIHNARLVERLQKNSELFNDLAASINSSLDIKTILHILTADIAEAFGMKGASISLLDKDADKLNIVASYGLSQEFLDKGPISAEKSVAIALKGETVVIRDVATDERIQYKAEAKKEGIVSVLNVPIKVKDEVIGVMRLHSGVQREFPEDMIMMVNAIAHQGGLAIQNASLYLSLQEDKKSLEQDIWSHRQWF
jgi:GAF domain-containing protein